MKKMYELIIFWNYFVFLIHRFHNIGEMYKEQVFIYF